MASRGGGENMSSFDWGWGENDTCNSITISSLDNLLIAAAICQFEVESLQLFEEIDSGEQKVASVPGRSLQGQGQGQGQGRPGARGPWVSWGLP